ncbi:VanZ family protein [Rubinisphaera margarita]|uniref:VanZ family protein n=1 Tax=Rubinisphaera margarita TaxID=2909586 RepID=UPI001EE9085B|nr:VanZ family protein [Rubinisphaera margarita]MCG6155652.1 VanZ family protein [Rubinisphaera margarita]
MLKTVLLILLIGYATTLVVFTHLPVEDVPDTGASDKLLHFGAYAVLGLLAAANLRVRRMPSVTQGLLLWASLAVFGAFDEMTQALVERSPELLDWSADIVGAAAGILAVSLLPWPAVKPSAATDR